MASLILQQRIKNAEDALDRLLLGQSARVVVDANGERVEYTPASAPRLVAYIENLKGQLDPGARMGPMRGFYA